MSKANRSKVEYGRELKNFPHLAHLLDDCKLTEIWRVKAGEIFSCRNSQILSCLNHIPNEYPAVVRSIFKLLLKMCRPFNELHLKSPGKIN